MIVCLVLFRLKQIIPTELPCAGLCSPKNICPYQMASRDQFQICFLSDNWNICVIWGRLV